MNEIPNYDLKISFFKIKSRWPAKDDGVKVVHVPTGLQAKCDKYRSQHHNLQEAKQELNRMLDKWQKDLQVMRKVKPHIYKHRSRWQVTYKPKYVTDRQTQMFSLAYCFADYLNILRPPKF